MNKKLIALAVAGACVAPAAMAQTANPVTLYGRVYLTLESVEAKAGGGNPEIARRTRISDQASLLGVRGTEDLGGGLKAFFQLETGFRADQNNTDPNPVGTPSTTGQSFAARNSGVGLQGNWGSILMGRWDTPYKVSMYPVDAFGDLTAAAMSSVGHDQGNFDRRDQNMVQYWSPTWAGIQLKGMWQTSEAKTATTNPHDTGGSLTYTGGPIYVFYAYEEHQDPSATVKKETGNSVGGYFRFGPLQVGAEYEEIKRSAVSGPDPTKRKEAVGNLIWTIGSNQLIYQYQRSKDGGSGASGATQPSCTSNTVAWKYNMSRRTFFLAQYMRTDNNDLGNCSYGTTSPFPIKAGNDFTVAAVGLQHVF